MSKFKFVCEEDAPLFNSSPSSVRTVEFSAVQLDDIVEEFEMFLKGCGFHFDGRLDFVEEKYEQPIFDFGANMNDTNLNPSGQSTITSYSFKVK
jgi:hypothetical protein